MPSIILGLKKKERKTEKQSCLVVSAVDVTFMPCLTNLKQMKGTVYLTSAELIICCWNVPISFS